MAMQVKVQVQIQARTIRWMLYLNLISMVMSIQMLEQIHPKPTALQA